jgi:capsular exopolysaccharide synthesis family protein
MENNKNGYPEFSQPFFPDDDTIDFKRYLSLFLSNWYWFAAFLFITFTISYGINRYSEEEFNVSSSLLIKDETQGGFTGMDPIFPGTEAYKNQQNLKNEMGILKSFDLNKEVIDSLPEFHTVYVHIGRRGIAETRQYKTTDFIIVSDSLRHLCYYTHLYIKIESDSTFTISIKELETFGGLKNFGDTIMYKGCSFTIVPRDPSKFRYDESSSNKYFFYFADPADLANEYRSKLQVSPIDEEATLVILSINGKVAQQEIDYLNMLMKVYIGRGLDDKNQRAELTIGFINEQLSSIHDSLRVAEDSLEQFRLKNRLVDIGSEGALIKSRLEKYETERTSLRLQEKYFTYLLGYLGSKVSDGDIIAPSVMGINDPVLERLITELSSVQQQKAQLGLNLAREQPASGLMDEKIARAKEALRENINSSLKSIDLSLADVIARISEVNSQLSELPATETDLIRIQRKFDLNNTVYTYLLEKRAEAGIARASNVSDNKAIDDAGLHSVVTVKPRKARNDMIALIMGVLLPVIAIFLIDYLNNKVIDKKDIERYTNVPILGFISHNEFKNETPVISNPSSTLSESFRSVRTALKFYTAEHVTPVIAISSTVSSEGKTFISVNLAAITAMLGKRVIVIGLDLRKPRIHKMLEVTNEIGMSNYLSGNAGFDEIIQETSVPGLFYAPAGPVPPNPAELIESDRMKQFVEEAKSKFDFVFIDTPPVAIVTDALLLSAITDINVFVVRQRYSSKSTLGLVQELYAHKKLKNMAIVINDISLSGYYGYGLRYGYTMKYGGYTYGYNFYGDYVYGKYGYKKESEGYYTEDR